MNRTLAATVCMSALVACGCAGQKVSEDHCTQDPHPTARSVPGTPVNKLCPIGRHDTYPLAPRVAYKGSVIAFCCEDCLHEWDAMTEPQRDKVLATALAP